MIDRTKPWFPQDYTLEEVLATNAWSDPVKVERDYNIRCGGVAGVFKELRDELVKGINELDPTLDKAKIEQLVTDRIENAIIVLEGNSIPDTKFVISEYAVPVFTRDEPPEYSCNPSLVEQTRPATAIVDRWRDMVNT